MDKLGATVLHGIQKELVVQSPWWGVRGHLSSTRRAAFTVHYIKSWISWTSCPRNCGFNTFSPKAFDWYLFLECLLLPRSSLAYSQPRVTRFKWLPLFQASQLTVSTVPTADITTSPEPKPVLEQRTEARVARGSLQLLNRRYPFCVGSLLAIVEEILTYF